MPDNGTEAAAVATEQPRDVHCNGEAPEPSPLEERQIDPIQFTADELEPLWNLLDQAERIPGAKLRRVAGHVLDKIEPLIEGRVERIEERKANQLKARARAAARQIVRRG